ncbi:hypothetical protein BD413DRAFT_675136 [Trametes elegans]|nr:hypothetical protein BD413DRAFT_675136 [Trametes elegans]
MDCSLGVSRQVSYLHCSRLPAHLLWHPPASQYQSTPPSVLSLAPLPNVCSRDSTTRHECSSPRPPLPSALLTICRPSPRSLAKDVILMCTVMLAMILHTANNTAVAIVLPTISRDLNIVEYKLQCIISAHSLSSGCLLLFLDRLADLYGGRITFVLGCAIMGIFIFSLGCAFANDVITLDWMDVDGDEAPKLKRAKPNSDEVVAKGARQPHTNRQLASMRDKAQASNTVKLRELGQREHNQNALVGESDHAIKTKMPKHLFVGKRKMGKTDRRRLGCVRFNKTILSSETYHNSISTIFELAHKYIHRSLDAAGDVNQAMSLNVFINDCTPDKHLITGIHGLYAFLEHLAGRKSLDGFFAALRVCAVDIQQDQDVRGWCNAFFAYLRRSLDKAGYVCSEDAQNTREKLPRRTEFKDKDIKFVLEDLDISTFSLLPGHAYIWNITDIDIKAPSASQADTAALQIQLKEVSFYYHDKTASVGPAEFTGILEFTLPPQGINVDIVICTIPNSPEGLTERERWSRFVDIQRVDVKVSEEINLVMKQSDHRILVSVFRPIMLGRLQDVLQTVFEQQLRAEVFSDTSLPRGASLRDADGAQFAMGAEPQVLLGEKRRPKGTFVEPVAEREDVQVKAEQAKDVAEQVKESAKEKVRQVKSFKDMVSAKVEEENARPGLAEPGV